MKLVRSVHDAMSYDDSVDVSWELIYGHEILQALSDKTLVQP